MSEVIISVTVVMPAHRRPTVLRQALESLRAQTYPHELIEIIVVATDGDGSAEMVAEQAAKTNISMRCISIPNDPFNGRNPSAKRNHGVQEARGEWIAFIDDDCIAHADWIAGAVPFFEGTNVGGVEGRKEIPPTDPPTNTYRGLLNFKRPGGYQTCNIFYRRKTFQQVKGFDIQFPFYLEDTDLAWTVLDCGLTIPHASEAVVTHPVTPPQPWRGLDSAKRTILMPYLYRKHKVLYRRNGTRALRPPHWAYIALYAGVITAIAARSFLVAGCFAMLIAALEAVHLYKTFRGCAVGRQELLVTILLLPIIPIVMVVQLIRGNLRYGVWLWT